MQASDALAGDLGRLVVRTQADERLPSVAAAVFDRDGVAWSDAVGLASVEPAEEATAEHQYRIGSITKTFTAAAIMQLRDAGELDLEDRLDHHLPEAAPGTLTLRRMLAHLSGLQREVPGDFWETMEFPDREGLLDAFANAEQVLPPGAHWHYSNLAFALLGEVVTRRSGMPYERFVDERLLRPVGLARTTWDAEPPVAQGYFVEPYDDAVRRESHADLRAKRPAGQLWSTVADLARWLSFLAEPDPAVLRPETAAEMRAFQGLADHERWTRGYGLGLQLAREGERIFFGHTGGMPGFITFAGFCAADGIGAAALTNASHGGKVIELGLRLAARAGEELAAPPRPWRPGPAAPTELEGVLGRWWSESSEAVFAWRDGRLEARDPTAPAHMPPSVFEPAGDGRYRIASGPERGEVLEIVRDASGAPVKLYLATYPFTKSPGPFGA